MFLCRMSKNYPLLSPNTSSYLDLCHYLKFLVDSALKEDASKKAFQNFEKEQKKATSQANPKEGVVSERFECKSLHSPSMFAVKAKIYGVLYKQSSSIAFDETSSY